MIAIDAMSGEGGTAAAVRGAIAAAQTGCDIALVGPTEPVEAELRRARPRSRRGLTLIAADHPPEEIANLVATKRARASISATPAPRMIEAAQVSSGLIPGIRAPAVAGVFPTSRAPVTVLDLGATATADQDRLIALARIGGGYATAVSGRPRPRIGLLAPRAPDQTLDSVHQAHAVLASLPLQYIGLVDGVGLFAGDVDVAVTDGTTGQILVETIEGLGTSIAALLREQIRGSLVAGAGALLMSRLGKSLGQKLEYPGHGLGTLVGLQGHHFVVHPSSGEKMWTTAIQAADQLCRGPGLIAKLESLLTSKTNSRP